MRDASARREADARHLRLPLGAGGQGRRRERQAQMAQQVSAFHGTLSFGRSLPELTSNPG